MITLLMTSDSQVVICEEKLNKNISPGSRHCLIVSQYFNLGLFHHFSFSLLPSLLGSLYLVFYPSSVYIPETQLLGGDTYTCTPRFLFCCWQFCGAVLCTGAQQSASNIDCWTSIVQQVTMP